jgi:hypothetical protein
VFAIPPTQIALQKFVKTFWWISARKGAIQRPGVHVRRCGQTFIGSDVLTRIVSADQQNFPLLTSISHPAQYFVMTFQQVSYI